MQPALLQIHKRTETLFHHADFTTAMLLKNWEISCRGEYVTAQMKLEEDPFICPLDFRKGDHE